MAISRIDQPQKHNHGYYVRVTRNGKTQAKFFPDKSNGGKRAALRAAKECQEQLLQWAASQERKRKKPSARNTSGIVGVNRATNATGEEYWQAAWVDSSGRRRNAKFSIKKYGEEKAKSMAKKARRDGIREKEQEG